MRLKISFLFVVILFLLFSSTVFADRAKEINAENAKHGFNWVAADNEVVRLHNELGWYTPGPLVSETWPEDFGKFTPKRDETLPAIFDWRNMDGDNYVTGVKNQAQCGSCWAFATTGPIETAIAYAEGWKDPKLDLSEQQLVSCSSAGGCETGGLTTSSFRFAKSTGLTYESCFKYKAYDVPCSNICDNWQQDVFKINDWRLVSLTGFSIEDMKKAVLVAPIAASIVIYPDFYYYESGVYDTAIAIPEGLHAVTIIGWDDSLECWIVKNSWGSYWGENGFFKIKYGTALIGSMSILPDYESRGLGPEPEYADDDDEVDDDDDNVPDDDDDTQDTDDDPKGDESDGSGDDDDDDSCGG